MPHGDRPRNHVLTCALFAQVNVLLEMVARSATFKAAVDALPTMKKDGVLAFTEQGQDVHQMQHASKVLDGDGMPHDVAKFLAIEVVLASLIFLSTCFSKALKTLKEVSS